MVNKFSPITFKQGVIQFKDLGYDDIHHLRKLINKEIEIKINHKINKIQTANFIEKNILIKPIDYYYTNYIARSSKVMNECRKISKKFLFTGIEKAS